MFLNVGDERIFNILLDILYFPNIVLLVIQVSQIVSKVVLQDVCCDVKQNWTKECESYSSGFVNGSESHYREVDRV